MNPKKGRNVEKWYNHYNFYTGVLIPFIILAILTCTYFTIDSFYKEQYGIVKYCESKGYDGYSFYDKHMVCELSNDLVYEVAYVICDNVWDYDTCKMDGVRTYVK